MRIIYNETFFGVQWSPGKGFSMATRSDDYLNYTVFWCHSVRDVPVVCQGQLYRKDVAATDTSLNVTVPDTRNYQFAVAANRGSYSSGMVWSSCNVIANGNGIQVKKVQVVATTSSSLDVTWLLGCKFVNGIITGFNIFYCPVADVGDCQSEWQHLSTLTRNHNFVFVFLRQSKFYSSCSNCQPLRNWSTRTLHNLQNCHYFADNFWGRPK